MLTHLLNNQEIFREICAIPVFSDDKLRFMYVHEIMEKTKEIEYFNAPFGPSPTGRIVSFKEFNSLARSSIIHSVFKLEKRANDLDKMKVAMEHFKVDQAKQIIIDRKIAKIKSLIYRVNAALAGEGRVSFYCQYRAIVGTPSTTNVSSTAFRDAIRLSLGIENISTPFPNKDSVFEVKITDPTIAQNLLYFGVIDDGVNTIQASLFAMQAYTPKRSKMPIEDEMLLALGSTFRPTDVLSKRVPFICHHPLKYPLPSKDNFPEVAYLQGEIYRHFESVIQQETLCQHINLGLPLHADRSLENCLVLDEALIHLAYVEQLETPINETARILLRRVANESNLTKKTIPREH